MRNRSIVHYDSGKISYHSYFGNVGRISPVCPIEISTIGIEDNRSRLSKIGANEHFSKPAIQLWNLDRIRPFVAPV